MHGAMVGEPLVIVMISELVINTTAGPRTTRLSRVHGAMVGEPLVIVMISELVINTTAGPRTTRLSRVHGAMVGGTAGHCHDIRTGHQHNS